MAETGQKTVRKQASNDAPFCAQQDAPFCAQQNAP